MKKVEPFEAILWSIALPGFAQLLSGALVKGILLVILEFLINVNSNFNEGIMLSFLGRTEEAAKVVDYQWLMFYPCLYMFAMWDAYKMASKRPSRYSYVPFAFAAFFITVGLMYSPIVFIHHIFIGPIFLPMIALLPGLLVGYLIGLIIKKAKRST